LLAAICTGSAGAVLALEASRLARNGRDWHTLLEFCSLVNCLIIDEDGVYDPKLVNDRLLLGMKGTFSELELSIIAALASKIEGRSAQTRGGFGIRARLDEQVSRFEIVPLRRPVKRGAAISLRNVYVGLLAD
jgi:DNA invertase Pin-like site-specific DNA recombinase